MSRALFSKLVFVCAIAVLPLVGTAQTMHQEVQEQVRAKVIEVVDEYDRAITGTGATTTMQELRIELLGGQRVGEVTTLENDIVELEVGDIIFVSRMVTIDGTEFVAFQDVERRPALFAVAVLFVLLLLVFAGWQGMRALLSLALSAGAILLILVPALLAGYSAPLMSFLIATIVLALAIFLTHGINARTVIAYGGTMAAVAVTCVVALLSVSWMRLTGFGSDASVYLNFSTGGSLDLAGVLLGSIIIGILGVLDDVSITQASVVEELKGANNNLTFIELYKRAIKVGRDHVGSLVNTLAFAYVGVSLPLVLLYAQGESSILLTINQEVVAAELLRIIVGSIGLILAVPFTTLTAAWYYKDKQVDRESIAHSGHHHHH